MIWRRRLLLVGLLGVALLAALLPGPAPASAAPRVATCAIADSFDFPLGPPHGVDWSVFQSFGNRRAARQGRSHTGEDWSRLRGRTLGRPVHAIAAGRVILAQPYAWGTEKGVILIEHQLPEGGRLISLYGHLDESEPYPAVGTCVARGDPIGLIGDPDTGPHLHFEIRTVLPNEAGPGYVYGDPQAQGWLSPSDLILQRRSLALPPADYRFEYLGRSPRDGDRAVGRLVGTTVRFALTLRNSGSATWYRDPETAPDGRAFYLMMGSAAAPSWDSLGRLGQPSPFFRPGLRGWWPDVETPQQAARLRLREAQVAPGAIGTFDFELDLQRGPRGRVRLWATPAVTGIGPIGDIGIRWGFWTAATSSYDLGSIAGDPIAPPFSDAERRFLEQLGPLGR